MPEVPGFAPSRNAPLFTNDGPAQPWPPGTAVTISVPGLPTVNIDATQFGLCGGMSFLTRDIFESDTPQLRGTDCTKIPLALAQYLVTRLEQSFDGPTTVARWLSLTALPDHDTQVWGPGVFHQTVDEFAAVMSDIDAGILSPLGLILTGPSAWPGDVFNNHVELAYGYELIDSVLTLHMYDCNNPGNDGITISLDISSPTPAKVISTNGTDDPDRPGQIRGFFHLPYTRADPALAYIDDATVYSTWHPSRITPGTSDTATVVATNMGSTSWTAPLDYRLGSQTPQDNTTWGTARVDLPVPQVDPQEQAVFSFPITAPAAQGYYNFAWQMVRDPDHFFGTGTPPEGVAVAPPDAPIVPNVVELHESDAEEAIATRGLKYQAVQLNAVPDHGTVVRQAPPAGIITTPGAVVTIWIAGKEGPGN